MRRRNINYSVPSKIDTGTAANADNNDTSRSREVEDLFHEAAAHSPTISGDDAYTTPNKSSYKRASFHQLQMGLSTSKRMASPRSSPTLTAPGTATSTRSMHSRYHKDHPGSPTTPSMRSSIRPLQDFGVWYHASTILQQSQRLVRLLVHGTPIWLLKMFRLMLFVVALIPAFMVTVWFYAVSSDRIAVPYILSKKDNDDDNAKEQGTSKNHTTRIRTSRHYLDIYGSTTTLSSNDNENKETDTTATSVSTTAKPVCIFLTGGAWIIGYKAWGTLLARTLVPFGILVVIPDYRNFPQTNMEGMLDDVDCAVAWTLANIAEYGGDPTKVVLAGQSAGAHLGACLLLQKAQLEAPPTHSTPIKNHNSVNDHKNTDPNTTSWHATDIKGFIATSGPYNLVAMKDILHNHGLDKSIVSAMFCHDVARYSPSLTIQKLCQDNKNDNDIVLQTRVQQQFPPTCVIHGEVDKTVPYSISVEFYEALKQLHKTSSSNHNNQQSSSNFNLEFKLYPSWSHTDPILEAPFAGNHLFHRDVYDLVQLWTSDDDDDGTYGEGDVDGDYLLLPFDESHTACAKICPVWLVQIARFCNPF